MAMKPGYKQTDVGVIPVEWETQTVLGFSRQIIDYRGRTPKKLGMDWGVGDIPALSAGNVKKGFIDFSEECYFGSQALYKCWMTRGDVMKDDIIFTMEAPLGNVALIPDDKKYILSQRTVLLKIDQEQASNRFLFQLMLSEQFQRVLADYSSGSTAKGIQRKKFEQLLLAKPPLFEQKVIATVLTDADDLIASLEQLIVKKRAIRQGAMQELFREKQGDTIKPLHEISTLKGRIGWQGLKQSEFTTNADEPFLITGMNFKDGAIRWNEVYHISEERYEMAKNIQLRIDDVLMTKDGTIGKVLYIENIPYPGKASLNSHLLLFRPIYGSYYPRYLYYQLMSKRFFDFVELAKSGTTFFGLSQEAVGIYPVLLPSMEEQIRIASILSDIDADIAVTEAKLYKVRQIKQGMMQELLTGRIRLITPVNTAIETVRKKSTQGHNWQINEAVVIAVLAKNFGNEAYPLSRFRYTKLAYLLHRHVEQTAEGYLKKAAGPYNPRTRYKGPEAIAQNNGYIRTHTNGLYEGFVASDNIAQADAYFDDWYGQGTLSWLEQFRYAKHNELEVLATVDMAVQDLCTAGALVTLCAVKDVIRRHPEWQAKLNRPAFADVYIEKAINATEALFG